MNSDEARAADARQRKKSECNARGIRQGKGRGRASIYIRASKGRHTQAPQAHHKHTQPGTSRHTPKAVLYSQSVAQWAQC